MYRENLVATLEIRSGYLHLSVESARSQQRRVENVGAVGRRDENDAASDVEPVHLDEHLIQCLFALIMTSTEPCTAMTTDSIDFVDEDDRRRILLRLLEEIAHT